MELPKITKSTDKLLSYGNKTQSLVQWCQELNLDYNTIQLRLQRGWNIEKAFTKPTNKPFVKKTK